VAQHVKGLVGRHPRVFVNGARKVPVLVFDEALLMGNLQCVQGAVTLVSSPNAQLAYKVAYALVSRDVKPEWDLMFVLDPLMTTDLPSIYVKHPILDNAHLCYVPTSDGASRALRRLVQGFIMARKGEVRGNQQPCNRVLLGDLGVVLSMADGPEWVEAIRVFGYLAVELGWGIPIIMYDSNPTAVFSSTHLLATHMDVRIHVTMSKESRVRADIIERFPPQQRTLMSSDGVSLVPSSGFDFPRPQDRSTP
jgi:hypothetical protein